MQRTLSSANKSPNRATSLAKAHHHQAVGRTPSAKVKSPSSERSGPAKGISSAKARPSLKVDASGTADGTMTLPGTGPPDEDSKDVAAPREDNEAPGEEDACQDNNADDSPRAQEPTKVRRRVSKSPDPEKLLSMELQLLDVAEDFSQMRRNTLQLQETFLEFEAEIRSAEEQRYKLDEMRQAEGEQASHEETAQLMENIDVLEERCRKAANEAATRDAQHARSVDKLEARCKTLAEEAAMAQQAATRDAEHVAHVSELETRCKRLADEAAEAKQAAAQDAASGSTSVVGELEMRCQTLAEEAAAAQQAAAQDAEHAILGELEARCQTLAEEAAEAQQAAAQDAEHAKLGELEARCQTLAEEVAYLEAAQLEEVELCAQAGERLSVLSQAMQNRLRSDGEQEMRLLEVERLLSEGIPAADNEVRVAMAEYEQELQKASAEEMRWQSTESELTSELRFLQQHAAACKAAEVAEVAEVKKKQENNDAASERAEQQLRAEAQAQEGSRVQELEELLQLQVAEVAEMKAKQDTDDAALERAEEQLRREARAQEECRVQELEERLKLQVAEVAEVKSKQEKDDAALALERAEEQLRRDAQAEEASRVQDLEELLKLQALQLKDEAAEQAVLAQAKGELEAEVREQQTQIEMQAQLSEMQAQFRHETSEEHYVEKCRIQSQEKKLQELEELVEKQLQQQGEATREAAALREHGLEEVQRLRSEEKQQLDELELEERTAAKRVSAELHETHAELAGARDTVEELRHEGLVLKSVEELSARRVAQLVETAVELKAQVSETRAAAQKAAGHAKTTSERIEELQGDVKEKAAALAAARAALQSSEEKHEEELKVAGERWRQADAANEQRVQRLEQQSRAIRSQLSEHVARASKGVEKRVAALRRQVEEQEEKNAHLEEALAADRSKHHCEPQEDAAEGSSDNGVHKERQLKERLAKLHHGILLKWLEGDAKGLMLTCLLDWRLLVVKECSERHVAGLLDRAEDLEQECTEQTSRSMDYQVELMDQSAQIQTNQEEVAELALREQHLEEQAEERTQALTSEKALALQASKLLSDKIAKLQAAQVHHKADMEAEVVRQTSTLAVLEESHQEDETRLEVLNLTESRLQARALEWKFEHMSEKSAAAAATTKHKHETEELLQTQALLSKQVKQLSTAVSTWKQRLTSSTGQDNEGLLLEMFLRWRMEVRALRERSEVTAIQMAMGGGAHASEPTGAVAAAWEAALKTVSPEVLRAEISVLYRQNSELRAANIAGLGPEMHSMQSCMQHGSIAGGSGVWTTVGTVAEVKCGEHVQKIGLGFRSMPPDPLIVKKVNPGDWADSVGMHPGDAILELNGQLVATMNPQSFKEVMMQRPLVLKIWRHAS
eukprot:TRINITY_DN9362_c0_g1_i3.p1 TRINITY_DN9362_c0_g1~~TRINITY_DN9362_c0_g1_i3.p1  ORF type:complete len:1370 (+),score=522.69 TRINITY_DN9362_c0_g1_i3:173-4282(+)